MNAFFASRTIRHWYCAASRAIRPLHVGSFFYPTLSSLYSCFAANRSNAIDVNPLTRLQLFMVPEFREGVLGFRDSEQMPSEDGVMWQLQNMFSHLQVRTRAAAAAAAAAVLTSNALILLCFDARPGFYTVVFEKTFVADCARCLRSVGL